MLCRGLVKSRFWRRAFPVEMSKNRKQKTVSSSGFHCTPLNSQPGVAQSVKLTIGREVKPRRVVNLRAVDPKFITARAVCLFQIGHNSRRAARFPSNLLWSFSSDSWINHWTGCPSNDCVSGEMIRVKRRLICVIIGREVWRWGEELHQIIVVIKRFR